MSKFASFILHLIIFIHRYVNWSFPLFHFAQILMNALHVAQQDWEYLLDSDCCMEWKEVFKTDPKIEDISINPEAKEEVR